MAFKIYFGNPFAPPPSVIAGVAEAVEAADVVAFNGDVTGTIAVLAASEAPDTVAVTGRIPTTLNPDDKSTRITLSNGNLTATKNTGAASYAMVRSTDSYASGKRYWEAQLNALDETSSDDLGIIGLATATSSLDQYLGAETGLNFSAGLFPDGAVWQNAVGFGSSTGKTVAVGGWAGLAVDYDAGKAWVRNSSGWHGDPVAGTGNAITFTPGLRLHAATQMFSVSSPGPDQTTVNFGDTEFAYAVPAGFEPWSGEAAAPLIYLRPSADVTLDGWTDHADGTSNIVEAINEASVNDSDYVQSPPVVGTDADLSVRLFDGATEIVEWTHTHIADTFVDVEQVLTGPQFAAISNFADLIAEFDDHQGSVYRFALGDPAAGVEAPVKVRYRYKKLAG